MKTNTCLREGKTRGPKKIEVVIKLWPGQTIETKIGHVRTSQGNIPSRKMDSSPPQVMVRHNSALRMKKYRQFSGVTVTIQGGGKSIFCKDLEKRNWMSFLLLLGGKDIQLHPQSFTRQQFRSWEIMPYRYWAWILSLFCSHHVLACTSPNCSRLWTSKTKTRCQWNIDVIYHHTRFRWIQYHNTNLKRKPEKQFSYEYKQQNHF